jgi:nucleoside-diphosphate-sugar epimerase
MSGGGTGLRHHSPEPTDPTRVVVLGGRGFVGRELVAALEQAGISTMAPTRRELELTAPDAGDRLAALLRPADSLVVLAALTPDRGRGIEPFVANMAIGAAIARALARVAPAHVVYVSSDAVYPMRAGRVSEASCAEPPDLYGMMHRARETMVAAASPAPLAILRPTLLYGAADTHNSYGPNRLRRAAHKEGRIALFGDGDDMRDHLFVDDFVALTLLVLRHRSQGVLNCATGRSVSYAELARKIAARFERPVEIVAAPRQAPVAHRHFDVTALHKAFPTFRFTPLDQGLARAHRQMLGQP